MPAHFVLATYHKALKRKKAHNRRLREAPAPGQKERSPAQARAARAGREQRQAALLAAFYAFLEEQAPRAVRPASSDA